MGNEIIRQEQAVTVFGVGARACGVVANTDSGRILNQTIIASREYTEGGKKHRITAKLRFDDQCRNGHETFSITGGIRVLERGSWREDACGCIHGEIAQHFPEFAHLIQWHLVSTDGPMHYLANTLYAAGDLDHYGLRAGERRQIKNGRTGQPVWELVAVVDGAEVALHDLKRFVDADTAPVAPELRYAPMWRIGEGKARDLDAARRAAVWPDATDEELRAPREVLQAKLEARLPALLADFKAAMLSCGFLWPEE